jgi:hypothetical protein
VLIHVTEFRCLKCGFLNSKERKSQEPESKPVEKPEPAKPKVSVYSEQLGRELVPKSPNLSHSSDEDEEVDIMND